MSRQNNNNDEHCVSPTYRPDGDTSPRYCPSPIDDQMGNDKEFQQPNNERKVRFRDSFTIQDIDSIPFIKGKKNHNLKNIPMKSVERSKKLGIRGDIKKPFIKYLDGTHTFEIIARDIDEAQFIRGELTELENAVNRLKESGKWKPKPRPQPRPQQRRNYNYQSYQHPDERLIQGVIHAIRQTDRGYQGNRRQYGNRRHQGQSGYHHSNRRNNGNQRHGQHDNCSR
tara:strand:+ start:3178 stop:3855 length:678 start_codon:yes stop_codon:yes gene_type:complete